MQETAARKHVVVDPVRARTRAETAPSYREIRTYSMSGQQALDYSIKITGMAKRYDFPDNIIFEAVEAMGGDGDDRVYLDGQNAQRVIVDERTILETDFVQGVATEKRYYNHDTPDKSPYLHERQLFLTADGEDGVTQINEQYNQNAILTRRDTYSKNGKHVIDKFDETTGDAIPKWKYMWKEKIEQFVAWAY